MAGKLLKGSRLTNRWLRQLLRLFALEVPAVAAARDASVSRHTAARVYGRVRAAMAAACEDGAPQLGRFGRRLSVLGLE